MSWHDSSSRDAEAIAGWHAGSGDPAWGERRERALRLLAEAEHLESVAAARRRRARCRTRERVVLLHRPGSCARRVLQQSSLSANDAYCAPAKQRALLELVLAVYDRCLELVDAGRRRLGDRSSSTSRPSTRARDATRPDDAERGRAPSRERVALDRSGELA